MTYGLRTQARYYFIIVEKYESALSTVKFSFVFPSALLQNVNVLTLTEEEYGKDTKTKRC
jgi:hypothetical protein